MTPTVYLDEAVLAEVTSTLDLREPNANALRSLITVLERHDPEEGPFVGVADVATGVGKTYILAGAIDYFATVCGVRNFAIIAPGRTILEKTIQNFTPGARKSLSGKMATAVEVVTSANFDSPSTARLLEDDDRVKVFVFTIQALTAPARNASATNVSRRTHEFQEGLGAGFYDHLSNLDDLIIFADEYHCYFGPAFSRTIDELKPFAEVGLTATPHRSTPPGQVFFSYPLAHAIAAQLVKTPVIVGRSDDRNDVDTKLLDGLALLGAKRTALRRYCGPDEPLPFNPVMLVVTSSIEDAQEIESIVDSPDFEQGEWHGTVLRVDSSVTGEPKEALLAQLDAVEDPDSPVRIIVSVGMLKEGWDVSNVYVIVSLRASVSDVLTEQTLGRGLRLPFGVYTNVELLDTLEVVAHERYQDLLRRTNVLREQLIDWRTLPTPEAEPQVAAPVDADEPETPGGGGDGGGELVVVDDGSGTGGSSNTTDGGPGNVVVAPVDQRVEDALRLADEVAALTPVAGTEPIRVPVVDMRSAQANFSLTSIVDPRPFRELGERFRVDPDNALVRTLVAARTVTGTDGIPRVEFDTRPATDLVESQGVLVDRAEARLRLTEALALAPTVPARQSEVEQAGRLVDAFLDGLGDGLDHLGAYLDRAAGGLSALVQQQSRSLATTDMVEVISISEFAPVRTPRPESSSDRFGEFNRRLGYLGWRKSMYSQVWFDSRPERDLANILDDERSEVTLWVRLHRNDLPILWHGSTRWYNPDFLVIDADGGHWVVEVKADRDLEDGDVLAKRAAAERWANRVTADPAVEDTWRYLLLGETDIREGRRWPALRGLYSGL